MKRATGDLRMQPMNGDSGASRPIQDQERLKSFEGQVFGNTTALLRTATRMCGNAAEADDIVQETLLRAWKYWDGFEQGTNCRAWLFRIMINLIRRRRETLESAAVHVSVEEPEIGKVLRFEPRLELDEQGALAALDKLPAEYKEIITLILVEEFSYKETALMLDVPLGTVMSRLHRARRMVQKMLKPSLKDAAAN